MTTKKPLVEIRGLRTQFALREGTVTALDGVDLTVYANESVGIVGETGCGKSMTAFSILRLVPPPGKITAGSIKFKGLELTRLSEEEMRGIPYIEEAPWITTFAGITMVFTILGFNLLGDGLRDVLDPRMKGLRR